ncbi:hypothetical protein LSM04_009164 [Trypanosoma melophagium]|uniref:uncharacterized protein n=1 Tax=Trypanosoma melophagium TaxID=715481 RepID=UPI00351A58AD|nr:hypothetical protein LSM04_009164 [Trypanosoma melophagium]
MRNQNKVLKIIRQSKQTRVSKSREQLLLSSHLPLSAAFTIHVLRPCISVALWRKEAAQPGSGQTWCLRLRLLAVQIPEKNGHTSSLLDGRCLAIVVQFAPFLSHPLVITAREMMETEMGIKRRGRRTGTTAILRYRRTKRMVNIKEKHTDLFSHTMPSGSLDCIIGDYTVDPPMASVQSRGLKIATTRSLPSLPTNALAETSLLPHHAVSLAQAKMLFSIFDYSNSKEETRLVGSATLPLANIMQATVDQRNSSIERYK